MSIGIRVTRKSFLPGSNVLGYLSEQHSLLLARFRKQSRAIMKYCIFGLQRSGTTFLESLIKLNFKCEIANGDRWKHTLQRVECNCKTFNIYKNPYTWIESVVYRDPADLLITSPFLLEEGYNMGHDRVNLANLAGLYNDYVLSWYDETTFVRYEDLLDEVAREKFLNTLPFERITDSVVVPEPGSLFMSEGFENNKIPYYLYGNPERLTLDEISIINEKISVDVFNLLGYKKLKSAP